jgi:uncharacterized protein (DUF3820 family)
MTKIDKLTDNSPMPWGKHKGEKMANVPAYYLLWCYDNNKVCDRVRAYVEENMDILEEQAEK